MSEINKDTDVILDKLANRYRTEIQDEELEEKFMFEQASLPEDDTDDLEEPILPIINLATLPVHEWNKLRVSKLSIFSDMVWDWRQEGSLLYRDCTIYNWDIDLDNGLPLLLEEHTPLVTLLRALLFYWMPQNAVFVNIKSFNSTVLVGRKLPILGRFLVSHDLYLDRSGNGSFKVVNNITPECFRSYYEKLSSASERMLFVRHIRHWSQLSHAGLLPADFQLGYEVFDTEVLSRAYKEFSNSKIAYQPIKLETLSILVPHCFKIIDNYAEDILFAYDLFWPVMCNASRTAAPDFNWHDALLQLEQRETSLWEMKQFIDPNLGMSDSLRYKVRKEIRRRPGWKSSLYFRSHTKLNYAPMSLVKTIAVELGIDLKEFDRSIYYDRAKVRNAVMNMTTMLRNACAFIIFLLTGMRRSELGNLEVGCCRASSQDEPGSYRLRVLVFKTSDRSQGDEQDIPIPRIAYTALRCMERLSAPARKVGKNKFLFASITHHFGKPLNLNSINGFLVRWCEELGLNEMIHPHQFRKTLAMFLIYQDTANLPLIKRLFSHKSLKMTLAYITKLPGIAQEVKLALLEQNMELIGELLEAARKGVIGGSAGLRIKESVQSGKYAARLNDDGWDTLDQYVDSLLDEGLTLLHRASLSVICTKTPAVEQTAPCDPPFAQKIKRLHPNIQNCDPLECKWAVFTESTVSKLVNEIKAHRKWLKHTYANDDQKRFSSRTIASSKERLLELGFNEEGEKLTVVSGERIA